MKITLSTRGLFYIVLAYLLLTGFLLAYLLAGWIIFIFGPIYLFFSFVLIVFVIISNIIKSKQNQKILSIDINDVWQVLLLQLFSMLLIAGDCGDGDGIHSLIQIITSPSSVCKMNYPYSYYVLSEFGFFLLILCGLRLFYGVFKTYTKKI